MNHRDQPHMPGETIGTGSLTDQQFIDLVRYGIRNDVFGTPDEFEAKQDRIAEQDEVAPPSIMRFVQNSQAVVLKGASYTDDELKAAKAIWRYGLGRDDFQQRLISKADEINRQLDIRPDLLKFEVRSQLTSGFQT